MAGHLCGCGWLRAAARGAPQMPEGAEAKTCPQWLHRRIDRPDGGGCQRRAQRCERLRRPPGNRTPHLRQPCHHVAQRHKAVRHDSRQSPLQTRHPFLGVTRSALVTHIPQCMKLKLIGTQYPVHTCPDKRRQDKNGHNTPIARDIQQLRVITAGLSSKQHTNTK